MLKKGICPTCKMNPVTPPFDHCTSCQMVGTFFQYEVWGDWARSHGLDGGSAHSCNRAFVQWRRRMTLGDMEKMRKLYWEAA